LTDARLENRRADDSAKCANCREWNGRDTGKSAATCERHKVTTTDLSVCSAWDLHEILSGRVMTPDDYIER
jgi:hypothetical protein